MHRFVSYAPAHRVRPPFRATVFTVLLTLVAVLALSAPRAALAAADTDDWSFALTPYVWLPTINAKLNFPYGGSGGDGGGIHLPGFIQSEIGPNQYLTKLNFALMLNGVARRGPWSVNGDFVGVWASGLGGTVRGFTPAGGGQVQIPVGAGVDHGTDLKLTAELWTVTGGYELVRNDRFSLDALAGIRYAHLKATMDWHLSADLVLPDQTLAVSRSGTITAGRDPLDAIVGGRGRYAIDDHWSIPYQADIGAGDTKLDWEVFTGVSYAFSWGDVSLLYRHLAIEEDKGKVFTHLSLGGPVLGATFRF